MGTREKKWGEKAAEISVCWDSWEGRNFNRETRDPHYPIRFIKKMKSNGTGSTQMRG